MSDLRALDWLEREDFACKDDRLTRLRWVAQLFPDTSILFFRGGRIAKYLFEESRYCFVYGQFLAAIVLGMGYVEHTLAALFHAAGRSDLERADISTLLREAVALGWIDQTQFEGLNGSRALRNAVVHFRPPLHKNTLEYRSIMEEEMPYAILEKDAQSVIRVVFRLFSRRTPF